MQYSSHLLVKTYILLFTATWGSCWQYFTPMTEVVLSNSEPDISLFHSEYRFGRCDKKGSQIFYSHTHLDHLDVLGKTIVRGWIDVMRIPTCIILRGRAYETELFRSTSYNFQMCVPRITYCFSHRRFKLHFYEWYIPADMRGGMDWDLYFFGPPSLSW